MQKPINKPHTPQAMMAWELTGQHVLAWWQNRFPQYASITAPAVRARVGTMLDSETQIVLRLAYFRDRLREYANGDDDLKSLPFQLNWLPLDSRPAIIASLREIGMTTLAEHLTCEINVIPPYVLAPTIDALTRRLDAYLGAHDAAITADMEAATGQSVGGLPRDLKQSEDAANSDARLLRSQRLLLIIERLAEKKDALGRLLSVPSADTAAKPAVIRHCCSEFQRDVKRCLSMLDDETPEIAEQWIYDSWQLMERHPSCFS